MNINSMNFTGTIWRPPYEANAALVQVTAGCSHHSCRFCSLLSQYKFRVSPLKEVEADLKVIQHYQPKARRLFLVGANPFVLSYNKLLDLGFLVRKYLPQCKNIGMFARITDIKQKSVEELKKLRHLEFNGITIGTETGDDITLSYMNKGTNSKEMLEQCMKLEEAEIEYYVSYLTGLAGAGNGERNALATAALFNKLHPYILSVVSLTVFPDSELYQDVQAGKFSEASEHERIKEVHTLVSNLNNQMHFLANTVSNPVPMNGFLPDDKQRLLNDLKTILDENQLKQYRKGIKSL